MGKRSCLRLLPIKACPERSVRDEAVMEAIQAIPAKEWQQYKDDRQIAETIHTMEKTTEAFRLLVQRWHKIQGGLFDPEPYCYHVIATNREETAIEV